MLFGGLIEELPWHENSRDPYMELNNPATLSHKPPKKNMRQVISTQDIHEVKIMEKSVE